MQAVERIIVPDTGNPSSSCLAQHTSSAVAAQPLRLLAGLQLLPRGCRVRSSLLPLCFGCISAERAELQSELLRLQRIGVGGRAAGISSSQGREEHSNGAPGCLGLIPAPRSCCLRAPSACCWITPSTSEAVTDVDVFSLFCSLESESPSLLLLDWLYSFQGRSMMLIPLLTGARFKTGSLCLGFVFQKR